MSPKPARAPLFVRWWPKDILDATATMDELTELVYRRLIDWIYAAGGKLPDDDRRLAELTKAGRSWKRIKVELIDAGKIEVRDGFICNQKCDVELAHARRFSERQSIAATEGASKRKQLAKSLQRNNSGSAMVGATAQAAATATAGAMDDAVAAAAAMATGTASQEPGANNHSEEAAAKPSSEPARAIPASPSAAEVTAILTEGEQPALPPPTDPAVALIRDFDEARAEVYGAAQRRPWPGPKDFGAAQSLLRLIETSGFTVQFAKPVFVAVFKRQQAAGERPADSLKYMSNAIADALREAATDILPSLKRNSGNGVPPPVSTAGPTAYQRAVQAWNEAGRKGPAPKLDDHPGAAA